MGTIFLLLLLTSRHALAAAAPISAWSAVHYLQERSISPLDLLRSTIVDESGSIIGFELAWGKRNKNNVYLQIEEGGLINFVYRMTLPIGVVANSSNSYLLDFLQPMLIESYRGKIRKLHYGSWADSDRFASNIIQQLSALPDQVQPDKVIIQTDESDRILLVRFLVNHVIFIFENGKPKHGVVPNHSMEKPVTAKYYYRVDELAWVEFFRASKRIVRLNAPELGPFTAAMSRLRRRGALEFIEQESCAPLLLIAQKL